MAQTFFFYDLETSGLNSRNDRIMQFAGQRTDKDLQPIGDPYNLFIALNDDTLPSPQALIVTGISPQQTVSEGYTEAQFAQIFSEEIASHDTTMVGFNNIRFDDEFIRALLWRNFYDPYAWSYKDGRSRWDLLDAVRMTRALRPHDIKWPEKDGMAVNTLELLAKENNLIHTKAHDALSDVEALIAMTKLLRDKQPQLYSYLLGLRHKQAVKALVSIDAPQAFVYTSGRYDASFNKTTVAWPICSGKNGNVIVYDLRYDPSDLINLSADDIVQRLKMSREQLHDHSVHRPAVKELQYNRAPAVAPLGVLAQYDGWNKIGLTQTVIEAHLKTLRTHPDIAKKVEQAYNLIQSSRQQQRNCHSLEPEARLYDGFINDKDALRAETVRNAAVADLRGLALSFDDERLGPLLLHYKARSFPKLLRGTEASEWEQWRTQRLSRQYPDFMKQLEIVSEAARKTDNENNHFIIQEMQLWAESIMPIPEQFDNSPDDEIT